MSIKNKQKIICLMGPTASGKTNLGIQLVKSLRDDPEKSYTGEIINVDSALVYKNMNIGTAKPNDELQILIPHHLINICEPYEAYSAAQFTQDCTNKILEIHKRGHYPLLTGGTMLYFRALQQGLSKLPSADKKIRAELEQKALKQSWTSLHQELSTIDPVAAKRIHPNDPQRIQRALEVYLITGKTMTELCEQKDDSPFEFINICISPSSRADLHKKIEQRFDEMLNLGFIDEVKQLYADKHLHKDLPAMRAVGYRQVWQYLDGELDYEQMRYKAIVATRQLAKRQLTWLRNWPGIIELNSEDPELMTQFRQLVLPIIASQTPVA